MSIEANVKRAKEVVIHFITNHPKSIGGAVIAGIALPFVIAARDGRVHPFDVPNSADINTDCRGSIKMGQIRQELSNPRVNYRGFLIGDNAIPAFNNAACNIPDIRGGNLVSNEFWIGDQKLTVGRIAGDLSAARYDGPWDSASAVAAYQRTRVQ